MIYIDTSCLIKLLREEPGSTEVRQAVDKEEMVIVSSLVELECEVQLKAFALGGVIRTSQWRQFQAKLAAFRNIDPFHFRELAGAVFSTALKQHRHPDAVYCRALDRLHLAAMEELKTKRIMTLDIGQVKGAKALNFEVVQPVPNK